MMPIQPSGADVLNDTAGLNLQLDKLSRILAADLLYVARRQDGESSSLQIIAMAGQGVFPRALCYALKQAPCRQLLNSREGLICHQPEHPFPGFSHLFGGPELYIGVPLLDHRQQPLGVCVALYCRSPSSPDPVKLLLMMELAALQLASVLPAVIAEQPLPLPAQPQERGEERPPRPVAPAVIDKEHFDVLTGLPGRNLFHSRLQRAVITAAEQHRCFAVVVLDIDSFGSVNNLLSHQAGDQLLQQIAHRLQQRIGPGDTLARTYSDEFAFLLRDITAKRQARVLAARLQRAFDQPFRVGERSLYLTASLGVTVFPDDHQQAEGLLRNLELALSQGKKYGRNQLFIYDASLSDELAHRHRLRLELIETIRQEKLEVYYQPILDNTTGQVCKLEALARWRHPQLGTVSPVEFIPLAEECGLIQALGDQVLRAACRQLKRLRCEGFTGLKMGINRSSLEFRSLGVDANEWLAIIAATGVRPADIIIEITESLLMDDDPNHLKRIAALRQAGVTIAIDDFGTGYSSLNYLRRFPADEVKIDRSFIVNIPANQEDMLLLNGIVEMIHNLGMKVVVEGVESEQQQAYLVTRRCDFTQGYLIGPPLPEPALLEFLREQGEHRQPLETREAGQ